MRPGTKFTEVDLGDGIEAVLPPSTNDGDARHNSQAESLSIDPTGSFTANLGLDGNSACSCRKHSQSSLQSSSSRTISPSTSPDVDEDPLKRERRETSPPAYQDVGAERRESDVTTSTSRTSISELEAGKQQTREERAAGKGFFSWLTRTRPPPPYPSERTVSPEYAAGIFSRLTFQWMSPMMSVSFEPLILLVQLFCAGSVLLSHIPPPKNGPSLGQFR